MIHFDLEQPQDQAVIENILDQAFGPSRSDKSSYALRHSLNRVDDLCLTARLNAQSAVVGTVRIWEAAVVDLLNHKFQDTLLLGPLAVLPTMQGLRIGAGLMRRVLSKIDVLGYQRVMLVGDIDFYNQFGFQGVKPRHITMPGGMDADRLLVRQTSGIKSLPTVGRVVSRDYKTLEEKPLFAA